MAKLPSITGKQAVAAFEKNGFVVVRISGSHHILKRSDVAAILNIPCHAGKTLGRGLLRKQIENAGLTVEQFLQLL